MCPLAYLLVAVIGYLLGCSNMALYIARYKKVDIRAKGSGNPGTANTVVLVGWKAGVLVGLHDIGKGVLAVLIAKTLFPQTDGIAEVAGAACVIGHIYPVFLKFKGGKGFASFVGMTIAIDFWFALIIVVVIALVTLIFDYLVVGTTVTVVALPVFCVFKYHSWIPAVIVAVATLLILFVHRKNFVRIFNGTEIGLRSTMKGEHRVK